MPTARNMWIWNNHSTTIIDYKTIAPMSWIDIIWEKYEINQIDEAYHENVVSVW